jgi:hypothetical protein
VWAWRTQGGCLAGHQLPLTHWALVVGPCWQGCWVSGPLTQLVSTALGFCTSLEAESGGEGRHGGGRSICGLKE